MKKLFRCLPILLLLLWGCAAEVPSREESIRQVVTALYNVPDDFHRENYQQLLAADGPESEGKAISARLNHNKSKLEEISFSPGSLDRTARSFAEKDIYLEPYLLPRGASLSCDSVEFIPVVEPGCEAFQASVLLTGEDGGETAYAVCGEAEFDQEGRLSWFEVTGDGGLGKGLGAAHWPGDNIIDVGDGPTPGPSTTPGP